MSRKQKKTMIRILICAVLFAVAILLPVKGVGEMVVFIIPYIVIGYDIILSAVRNLFRGQVLDENFLMSIASVGAFFTGDFHEGVAVMMFYQVGNFFEVYAVGKTRRSVATLMDIRPDHAVVLREGVPVTLDPEDVKVGELLLISPGEKIPLDGIVKKGNTSVNNSALTGESVPVDIEEGDTVISGSINISGTITVAVLKEYGESTVSKILELVENSAERKARTENFITRFARYYTPFIVISALIIAVIPSMITGAWSEWIHRALIFLVVSCPCALVISVPMSFFGGIGGAARQGILIKGSNYLEALSKADTVVFDKTGTLTKGTFKVSAVYAEGMTEEELLLYAAKAESRSSHPVAVSVVKAYGKEIDNRTEISVEEIAGKGVKAVVDGKTVCVGNLRLMESLGVMVKPCDVVGTVLHVAINGAYTGYIVISDSIKEDSAKAVKELKALGIKQTVMLTGDIQSVGESVAGEVGVDQVYAQLLPEDKVFRVENLLSDRKAGQATLVYVGDGINDAPVLSRADVGIAMGALGSDAAIEAADIVLMDDKPSKIAEALRIARKTMRIVRQNIVFALGVKAAVLLLAVIGLDNMWLAVFADVGVSVIAIINAMRSLGKVKK